MERKRSIGFLIVLIGVLLIVFTNSGFAAVPAAPGGLTAIAGNREASLKWNSVAGAASYVLYSATASGGPYSFIAHTLGTGYSDRGLTNLGR